VNEIDPTVAVEAEDSLEDRLGRALIDAGKLQAAGLERARRVARSGAPLHVALTRLGLVSEGDMAEALARELDLPLATRADYPDAALLEGSAKFLTESRVMPLADEDEALILAMADPLDSYAIRAVELLANKPVKPWVGLPADIEAAIERAYGGGRSQIDEISHELAGEGGEITAADVERLRDLASEAPVIRLVNMLITRAVESRASDVHIEPFENQLRVRYRIDGVLHEVESPPSRLSAAIISRVKLMAKLNIAERRLPQDGRIKLAVRGSEIDLRVATLPTMHGESVVLRILDRGSVRLDFASLGFRGRSLERLIGELERPNGIVLVTGPTGSGKTTTLYAALERLNAPEKKILTVEDPIEYQLDGVNQIQVKPQIGLSFANVLRSFLRHDPDIIMVGEIRDLETAQIAVQAALTGHLVLSTLHTNNAASTVTRLLDMGVDDYLLTATVNGIAAQRLVRTLCPQCREPYRALPEMVADLRLDRFANGQEVTLYRAKGCGACNGTGYRGRTNILEMLVMTDSLRAKILGRAEWGDLQQAAVAEGMDTMQDDGLQKAIAGKTTIEEILRVTREV
jgi:general secretion pathway protein E